MKSPICEMLGIEFPLLAFSHCRDVVAAVSRAGGMGVFGAANYSLEEVKEELAWIDDHVDGKPYGLDLIVPNKVQGKGKSIPFSESVKMLPPEQRDFANQILEQHGVDTSDLEHLTADHTPMLTHMLDNLRGVAAEEMLEIAFQYPIKLIANALGVPPQHMINTAKSKGVPIAALVGSKDHALTQVDAGVDILIAAGGEAGGHCGDVATMVLIPEICRELRKRGNETPVLAAGGIATGEQMAASMAMGAAGAWCGSVWLTTAEAETAPAVKEKMLVAGSEDTIRSPSRTGKPSRQLQSPWTAAWEAEDSPEPLGMPLQLLISEPALRKLDKLSQTGHKGATELSTYWVGQCVGLMNETTSAGQVVQNFKAEFIEAYERLSEFLDD